MGRLAVRRVPLTDLGINFGVARLEHADERAGGERRAGGLDFGELAAPPEDVEKPLVLAERRSERPRLVKDDGPRGHREHHQYRQHRLVDGSRFPDETNYIGCPGDWGSTVLHLQCKDERAKRVQRSLPCIGERAAGTAQTRQSSTRLVACLPKIIAGPQRTAAVRTAPRHALQPPHHCRQRSNLTCEGLLRWELGPKCCASSASATLR
jgi:hypothetical protein